MTSQDKRKFTRINSLNLSYVLVDGAGDADRQTMGRTLDVSEAGVRLETHLPVDIGRHLMLSVGLEDDVVDIKGHVVHAQKNRDGKYELGIELFEPDEAAREILKRFIAAFRQQRGPSE
ncbi:MAG: PilZ domain-containing protein [Deltaproteobacteria bacterium]|nr:PilZ domain-containing protein [Deltaproteobacteria bacterium]